jgi:hypothetical protein
MKAANSKVGSMIGKDKITDRLLNIPKANIKGASCGCDSLLNIGPKMNSLISKR